MVHSIPKVNEADVYNVKETCWYLGICKDTLTSKRRKGMITPTADKPYRYTGAAILRLWKLDRGLI